MPSNLRFGKVTFYLVVFALVLALPRTGSTAPNYRVLHAFSGGTDGGGLWGQLLLNGNGNLFGTTTTTVFELTPHSNGKWSLQVLHRFGGKDGEGHGGLILDRAGNLYGGTPTGGVGGYGTVFELSPSRAGWKETILHSFRSTDRASGPHDRLLMDYSGILYGTGGSAYQLYPGVKGWKLRVLHDFPGYPGDGSEPYAGLTLIGDDLYGVTRAGGSGDECDAGCGTLYEIAETDGNWKESLLHDFGGTGDGAFPSPAALAADPSGNLYGTTNIGGPYGYGTVFRFAPQPGGHWKETILHSFKQGDDGDDVSAGVVIDNTGAIYGTTIGGGDPHCDCGVVYKLALGANGHWAYAVLHRFTGPDGAQPDATLVLDAHGHLYGTTATGGARGLGVVFELTP